MDECKSLLEGDAPPSLIGDAYTNATAAAAPYRVHAEAFEAHALAHAAALEAWLISLNVPPLSPHLRILIIELNGVL